MTGSPKVDVEAFASWLLDAKYSPHTARDARRVAAAFLADRTPRDLTANGLRGWAARQPVSSARRDRLRVHLNRLREYVLLTQPQMIPADPVEDGRGKTVEDFLRWLKDQGCSPRTISHRRAVVNAFLHDCPTFLAIPGRAVEDWLGQQKLSDATKSTYRTHLRSLYRWAELTGLAPTAHLAPRGGPGTATSVTNYGRGRVLLAVNVGWQKQIEPWIDWLSSAGRPDSTLYLREYQLRRFAADNPLLKPLEVTVDGLAAWMAGQMWSIETRRSYLYALRSFYGWAHSTGRRSDNPADLLPRIIPPRAVARPTPEPVYRAALEHPVEHVALMIRMAAHLGLRRGEIARAHARDVVQDAQGWALVVTGKGGHQRRVPLHGEVCRRLLARVDVEPDAYLFPGQVDGHLSPARVGELVSEVLGRGWTTHTLRHRFATSAYAGQRDLFAVQTLLGHASPNTTRRYVQLPDDALRVAMAAAAE